MEDFPRSWEGSVGGHSLGVVTESYGLELKMLLSASLVVPGALGHYL